MLPSLNEFTIFLRELFILNLKTVSFFGDSPFIITAFIVFSGIVLVYDRHKREFLIILLSFGSYLVSTAIKLIFKTNRPAAGIERYSASITDLYSFPSSHVVFYTAFWGYILYLCIRMKHESKKLRYFVGAIAIYFITTIGISRYFLGFHWLRDIFGGYFIGLILLYGLILLDISWKRFKSDDKADSLRFKLFGKKKSKNI